jgi:ketosteroid isomerase-like protein
VSTPAKLSGAEDEVPDATRPTPSESTVDQVAGPTNASYWRRFGRVVALLAAALVLVTAAGVWATVLIGSSGRHTTERASAAAAAQRVTLGLVDLDHTTSADDIKALMAASTGQFANQLSSLQTVFSAALQQNEVVSRGQVLAIGISSMTDVEAVALVAAQAQISNKQTGGATQPRQYRLRLTLDKKDDKWLVSRVEFVA